jgi:hypothetical protein
VQLYEPPQLQFGWSHARVSQFWQLMAEIVQYVQLMLPQLQLDVQLPLLQLPALVF